MKYTVKEELSNLSLKQLNNKIYQLFCWLAGRCVQAWGDVVEQGAGSEAMAAGYGENLNLNLLGMQISKFSLTSQLGQISCPV